MTTLNLSNDVVSAYDLKALILEIEKYSQWYGQTTVKLRYNKAAAKEQPTLSSAATELINQAAGDGQLSQKQLDDLLYSLHDLLETLPQMTITLAAPAPGSLRRQLADWARKNLDPNTLVNFKFNATILGGMVVSYGSRTFDWSFRRQIIANRYKLAEHLRHV